MTTETHWHRHWNVRVKQDGLVGGVVYRVLTQPIWWEADIRKVAQSKYPYRPAERTASCKVVTEWCLTPLGVLHRWTGLTLFVVSEGSDE